MKGARFILIIISICQTLPLLAAGLASNGPLLKAYEEEFNPTKKKELAEKMIRECPFKRANSELESLTNESLTLQTSANVSDARANQCAAQLQYFNESISRTAELKNKLDLMESQKHNLSPEEQAELNQEIKTTQIAATSFNNLLQFGCEFRNSSSTIAAYGNQLINVLDTIAAFASLNPVNIPVATTAAISARLVVSLSRWLFEHPSESQILAKESNDSKRFINDLCLFRTLAYKYDDIFVDPFNDSQVELKARMEAKNNATALVKELRQCVAKTPNESLANLVNFSRELSTALEANPNQKQCLNLVNKYKSTKAAEGTNHLKNLATTYGCPDPAEDASTNAKVFCKVHKSIEFLTAGDIYEKCEKESFQKIVATKFTTLADLLFHSIQDNTKQSSTLVSKDELQKLKIAEQEEKVAIQRYASLQAILEDSPMNHVHSSKAMLALGRTILGKRFDDFSELTLKSTSKNLSEASGSVSDLLSKKKSADREKNEQKRIEKYNQICTIASQARQQLSIAYHSTIGINDICYIMKDRGVPPLKSNGLSFDNYSSGKKKKFGIFSADKYLSEKCEKISKKTESNFNRIKSEIAKLDTLECKNP